MAFRGDYKFVSQVEAKYADMTNFGKPAFNRLSVKERYVYGEVTWEMKRSILKSSLCGGARERARILAFAESAIDSDVIEALSVSDSTQLLVDDTFDANLVSLGLVDVKDNDSLIAYCKKPETLSNYSIRFINAQNSFLLGLSTRGSMTRAIAQKVNHGMADSYRNDGVELYRDEIPWVYSIFGKMGLTHDGWKNLFKNIASDSQEVERIKTMMERAEHKGFASASFVKRAHELYTDFNWEALDRGLPVEAEASKKVAKVMESEPYRMFSDNSPSEEFPIGKYRQYAKICWRILIIGGETSAQGYRGFENVVVKHNVKIEEKITAFFARREGEAWIEDL